MYTNPLLTTEKINSDESLIKSIQGPCGNTIFQLLSTTNDYDGITNIPQIDDEQIVLEEHYSNIDGCFGTV